MYVNTAEITKEETTSSGSTQDGVVQIINKLVVASLQLEIEIKTITINITIYFCNRHQYK